MTKSVNQQTGFVRKKEREIHEGRPGSLWKQTEKRNLILVEDRCTSHIIVGWPLLRVFQMATLFGWPTAAHNGRRIYVAMKIYRCSLGKAAFILIYKFKK